MNGNPSPADENPESQPAQVAPRWGRRRVVMAVLAGVVLASLVFVFVALRRAHGVKRTEACPSAPAPAFTDEQAAPNPESDAFDAGPPASSTDEASSRAFAWKPPLAGGLPSRGDRKAALPIRVDDHCLGSHGAQVTLMLFGDLHCPYTLRMLRMLRLWLDESPRAFRLVWRERPLDTHTGAANAALVAERIAIRYGEAAFWRFIVALSELDRVPSDSELSEFELSLESGAPRTSVDTGNSRAAAKLERDRLLALTYAIHETPTLFVNGWRVNGEISRTHLEQLIRDEQVEVDALIDDLAPSGDLYTIRVDANLLDWVRE